MKTLFLVDQHWRGGSQPPPLPDLGGVELVLLGGDISHFGGATQVRAVVEAIQAQGPTVFAVAGNCDRPEVEVYLNEAGIGLDQKTIEWNGLILTGLSGGLPFGGCPYERTEAQYAEACRQLPDKPTILVSHQPAKDTACDLTQGNHVGSSAIREYILKSQPQLVLSGHIHESIGTDTLGQSRLANPGPWAARRLLTFEVKEGAIGPLELQHLPL